MPTKRMTAYRLIMLLGKLNRPIPSAKVPRSRCCSNIVNLHRARRYDEIELCANRFFIRLITQDRSRRQGAPDLKVTIVRNLSKCLLYQFFIAF